MSTEMPQVTATQRYNTFDYLRLFLALEVVYFHASRSCVGHSYPMMLVPVPSFLAISGYMILQSWRTSSGPGIFWIKRGTRILPAFLCSFVLVGVLHGSHNVWRAFLNWLSFGQIWSVNTPLWSLSCEEVIYLALSVCCTLALVNRRGVAIVAAVLSAVYLIFSYVHPTHGLDYLALPMAFSLGLFAREYEWTFRRLDCLFVTAYLLMLFGLIHPSYPVWTFFSCVATLVIGRNTYRLPPLPADYSYGIYVYHMPIIVFLARYRLDSSAFVLCLILGVAAVVVTSFHLVESPVMRLRSRWVHSKRASESSVLVRETLQHPAQEPASSP